jgi:UDP-N-acetylmuramate dehydrogenase
VKVLENASLKDVSTFGIGGQVCSLVTVEIPDEMEGVVRELAGKGESFRVFAGGSNIVFPDEGLDGTLVRFFGGKMAGLRHYDYVQFKDDRRQSVHKFLAVDGGVMLSDVIERAISLGWRGLETLSGIPGTVGGAVVGNAGAYGRSMEGAVEEVDILDYSDLQNIVRRSLRGPACGFRYRHSVFKENSYVVLRVTLRFEEGDSVELGRISREIIAKREQKYKPGLRCPGSFFKNVLAGDVSEEVRALVDSSKIIEGKIPTGWLLEQVGAKGMRVGDIEIADFHGNLFVNRGEGTASDVKELARVLKERVQEKFGIELEEEIRYF